MNRNRIRDKRIKLGLSQVEVARRAHIAGPNLSTVERNRMLPWPKLRRDLARILKTTQGELFPQDGNGKAGS